MMMIIHASCRHHVSMIAEFGHRLLELTGHFSLV